MFKNQKKVSHSGSGRKNWKIRMKLPGIWSSVETFGLFTMEVTKLFYFYRKKSEIMT